MFYVAVFGSFCLIPMEALAVISTAFLRVVLENEFGEQPPGCCWLIPADTIMDTT